MKNIAPIVARVLETKPLTRSNDHSLIANVWWALGLRLTKEQYELLKEMPSAESITRVRRKFQERGLYPADPTVKAFRDTKSKQISLHGHTAEQVDSIINREGK